MPTSAPVLAQRLERAARFSSSIGLGTPLREFAVGLVVHLDELERQVRLELVDDEARAAVAGVARPS